jgi:hypothetical protein
VSDQEAGRDGTTSSGSTESPGADVLLRTTVPPYRLGELLLWIGELALTGRLSLASDMGRRTILFHSGFPVFTQSSLFAERLGAIGVRHGFFGREDVARALTHARERRHGLGESLLELGYLDPGQLHALLGVQLREVVTASCGSAPQRARFLGGGAALRDVIVLKLHPMTAVLASVAGVPAVEQNQLLKALAERELSAATLPRLVQRWLRDLGFTGDDPLLPPGELTVAAARSQLLERLRAGAEQAFDPAQVACSFAGSRVLAAPLTPDRVVDLVTLALLMSGALELADRGVHAHGHGELLANTAESLQSALDAAVERPVADPRANAAPAHDNAVDQAISRYLCLERERTLAAAAAVWGPSTEARDSTVPPELLRLYLTLKPEKRPDVVLGVAAEAAPEQVMQAYAQRVALIASVDQASASEHLQCRAAELSRRFDDALDALLPGTTGRSSLPPPPALPAESRDDRPDDEPAAHASRRSEAMAAKVDALMRAGQWRAVLDAFADHPAGSQLSFTLQLARAMAQRELQARRTAGRRWSWLAALILGLAIGYLLRHFDIVPPAPLTLPPF